ncbi:chloride channel protein [Parabacteroides sp. AM08-6]|uniref:chloride channel protein n=1 Tax=Parabacteroides sp. AM08-6 TaxID=2292053 RepID=UPI000EFFD539|nr:chloride channel protein [Parabacteroides sp. AM08-6]RHJ83221.1 CBS domain-containing protein [Parabacteroides sp. AM08-6]
MAKDNLFYKFLLWKDKHIKEKHFILIISFLVGICTAATAIILKWLIHLIQHLLTGNFSLDGANYLYLLYPVIGILLAGLFVKYIVRDDISHGVTKILYAISQRKSRIKPHNTWTSIVASSVTIGFGGSVGAEAPIVLTGAAIGSNLGRMFRMEQKTLMLLVGCGAAGAIAGIFKAPIAGLVFVIEVLLLDLTMTSVLPLLISSVTAATVSYIFTGTEAMFKFSQTEVFEIQRIPYVLLLGVFCGLVSLYFTRVMNRVEGMYRKLGAYWKKFVIGGLMLSILIFLFPPLYGEGYDTIGSLLNGQFAHIMDKSMFYSLNDTYWGLQVFLFLILLTKVFASSATNAGGGCGGIFAPSLYLGCIAGFVFAHASNYFPFTMYLSEKNFALLGMAGIMSGVMHAPLTGVFLIAELTGGYDLFLPLMIVSIGSYITILMFEPHSIYSMRLAQKGELLTHHKDRAVLTLLNTDSIIERDFLTVSPEMSLGDMVKVIAKSGRNAFPVIDEKGYLLGIVLLDNIRNIMFRPELYNRFHVSKFMVSAPDKIQIGTPMEQIMRIFDDTKAWNLPVVDEEGRYVGFMSKSKIFNSYREVLVENFSGD